MHGRFGPIAYCTYRWGCWVRIFGPGLSIQRIRSHPLLFSERHGHRKIRKFCGLRFEWLPAWEVS